MGSIVGFLRVLVALLVLATAVPAVLALFGFVVPVFDLLNHLQLLLILGTTAAAAASLVLNWKWRAIAVAGLLAFGSAFGPEWLSSLSPREEASDVASVKVMTHNLFGLNYDMARVAAVVRSEDPDIVAVQEFFPEQSDLIDLLEERYPYWIRCQGGKRANLGLFSRLPFDSETTSRDCPKAAQSGQRTAHILVRYTLGDGTAFSLMTTHMDWPYPIERQARELDEAAETIAGVDGPLLVVGDFNSTPWSYALKRFEAGTGLRRETRGILTYPKLFTVPDGLIETIPFLPLDQVFQRGLAVSELRTGPETGSDHLPVVVTFSVARGN